MTQKITETTTTKTNVQLTKIDLIKAWTPIITSLIALISAGVVALTSASSANVNSIVKRLDDKIIPKLEKKIDAIEISLAEVHVYQKIFKDAIENLKTKHPVRDKNAKHNSIAYEFNAGKNKLTIKKFKLPRVQVQQKQKLLIQPVPTRK